MAETKLYNQDGKITCDKDILYSIVSLAAKEIKGVARLSNSLRPWYKKLFSKGDYEGVKIRFEQNGTIKVDVYVDVYIGESVPDLAFRVQENIKNNLSGMVEMKASNISEFKHEKGLTRAGVQTCV